MNTESPKQLALLIAFLLAVILGAGNLIISKLLGLSFIANHVLFFVITIVVSYVVVYLLVAHFISEKIKLIHKTIHSNKLGPSKRSISIDNDAFQSVNRDVEEWAKENEKAKEDFELKEGFQREFIGNVSHELKTPIFNIQGYILTLLEGGLEDEKINRKYLIRAEKSVNRMIDLVDDLETITKLETSQLQLNIEKNNILTIANEVVESLEEHAKSSNISVTFNKEYLSPILVSCDRQKIFQVLSNLVVNSIKYGKANGQTELRFYPMEDNILVEISDNGAGIADSHLPRLFERFYRVEGSRSREKGGSGLGLAIVKHIVEAHEQTINVRSTEGVGSTFSFTLAKA
jgi:two-component system phosphate regulon sensor histidine kinase PhoR